MRPGTRHLRGLAVAAAAAWLTAGCVTTTDKPEVEEIPEEAARINVQLGGNYLRQGKLDLAKEKLDKALEQNPQLAIAHTYSALLMDQLGEPKKAEAHYRRSLRLAPGDSVTLNLYGAFLCRQDRAREAEKYFAEATEDPLYRTPWAALTNAGICLLRVPDQESAEAYFRRALSVNPNYPDALWQMARLNYERKLYLPARAFFQRYIEGSQITPEALWLGVRIERQLGDAAAVERYAKSLREDFPEASETRLLIESERDGGAG